MHSDTSGSSEWQTPSRDAVTVIRCVVEVIVIGDEEEERQLINKSIFVYSSLNDICTPHSRQRWQDKINKINKVAKARKDKTSAPREKYVSIGLKVSR